MIFITIMHQFNVIIHVKRVCGYVVDFCGYSCLKWQGLEGTYKCFRASKGMVIAPLCTVKCRHEV